MIELVDVAKAYANIRGLTLRVAAGEFVAIVGESGSGKTTVVRMINRLIDPDGGTVRVDGVDVRERDPVALRRGIGYVIQSAGLFPHRTIASNVGTVPRLLGWTDAAIAARVGELLELVGLPPATYSDRFPDQLSGGQRQRAGIARALAAKPKVLLLDEPLGAVDPITRVALQGELVRIHRELALTTVMVTHDLIEALALADRIAVMLDGRLVQVGTPRELLDTPADDYVAKLMGMARHQAEQLRAVAGA